MGGWGMVADEDWKVMESLLGIGSRREIVVSEEKSDDISSSAWEDEGL